IFVLNYRREIALIFHDLPYLLHAPSFADVMGLTDQLAEALAGGDTEPAALLAVKVIMAGIAAVVVEPVEYEGVEVRAALIRVARRGLALDA
ncbi:MAG TPA: hypothetical protein VHN18_07025, partial [Micromonosporaceae bacterium]|nr:hypothetical protein [Micromonosporaceae bacterium]